ncbi:TonB-dependent receptor [Gluconacetobacter tumulisoli]
MPARAQTANQSQHPSAVPPTMLGSTAPTDVAAEHVEVTGHSAGDGVTRRALGGGLMVNEDAPKSKSTVTRDFIEKQTPGLNPFQLMTLMPGVNTSDTDPMGLTGGTMTVRGMTQSQMGFTLEGFPLSDIGSGAIYPQEILDSENLQKIQLAQGSADLDSPVINASGGIVNMYMIDPLMKMGGRVNFSYGSFNSVRGFVRYDTGLIAHTNARAYFSFSDTHANMWRGPGMDKKIHGEMKFVNDWGQGNRISLAIVGNQLNNAAFPSTNLTNYQKFGDGVMGAPVTGNTVYSSVYTGDTSANSTYYKLHQNPFTNIYASAPSTFTLTDRIVLTETPYFWYGNGNGGGAYYENLEKQQWGSQTMGSSINGVSKGSTLLYNPSNTQTYRPGAVTKVTLTTGPNRLLIGYWFEYSKQFQTGPYSGVNADGTPADVWGGGSQLVLANGETQQYRDAMTQTTIHAPFIGDSLSLLHDRLTLDAGFKYAIVTRRGQNNLPDTSTGKYISQTLGEPLPTAAVRFKINDENQLFVSGATNFRMPANTSLYDAGTYYSGSGYTTHGTTAQKPEISISEEAGWRYQGKLFSSSITYFHYNFTNRLYTQTVVDPTNPANYWTSSINGGNAHSDGVDFEIGTRPIYNFRPYVSAEYLHAVTDSNIAVSAKLNGSSITDYVRSAGKIAPQAPKYTLGFGLDYDDGSVFGTFNLKYTARQYSTFMDDQSIPGFVRMNVSAGYRFPNWGPFKSPHVQINLQNIANTRYLGAVSGVQATANAMKGVYGGAISGSAPTYSIASPFSAIGSISSDF